MLAISPFLWALLRSKKMPSPKGLHQPQDPVGRSPA
jgi:hypothetical protein